MNDDEMIQRQTEIEAAVIKKGDRVLFHRPNYNSEPYAGTVRIVGTDCDRGMLYVEWDEGHNRSWELVKHCTKEER